LAEISPFQGVRYNQQIIKDLASVICPPYDIITPEEQKHYYEISEYNVIRLEHGLIFPDDTPVNNKHSRSRDTFKKWMNDNILRTDESPTFYIYEQGFTYKDTRKKRLGLIAVVMLEPWENKVILPHENTTPRSKSDRLDLMRACNANISPVFSLYDDPGQRVTKLMQEKMRKSKLLIDVIIDHETHKVWKANEPEFVQRISHFISPKTIYIADGHHRYETALTYQEERRKISASQGGYEAYNFVMMTLVPFSDPGLIILPVHRLIAGLSEQTISDFESKLNDYFEIQSFALSEAKLDESMVNTIRVLGLQKDKVLHLRLRKSVPINQVVPPGHSETYQKLDICIFEHLIREKLLGLPDENNNIVYTPDIKHTLKLMQDGQCQLAFLMNQLSVATIKSIADDNDRMPRKSTFFYPKLPTGLVLNRLDGKL